MFKHVKCSVCLLSNNRSVKFTFNERLIWDCLFSLSSLFFSSLGGLSWTRSILPISSTLPILSSSSFIFTLSRELSKGLDKTKLIFKAQGFSINQYIFYLTGTVSVIKAPSPSHNLYLGSVHGCSVAPDLLSNSPGWHRYMSDPLRSLLCPCISLFAVSFF